MSGSDHKPPHGLPAELPEGERVLWQRSPQWRPFARRVFQVDKIGLYFLVLIGWVAASAWLGGDLAAALRTLAWTVPPALGVLVVLGLLGWLYARTTVYTVTDKRIVVQSGLAFPAAINLPFASIERADLKTHADGTGDIDLSLTGQRVLYSMLWPNVRMLQISEPRPVLRALRAPHEAAETLGRALAADQKTEEETASRRDRPDGRAEARQAATA